LCIPKTELSRNCSGDFALEEARERRGRPDPTGIALEQALGSLPPESRIELMALVWFGRGDSIETDFAEHVAEVIPSLLGGCAALLRSAAAMIA
jgi:hypothetical protein